MANSYFNIKAVGSESWLDLPAPSSLKFSYEDIDNDSYRSVITGNLIRKPITYKWAKISVSYNFLTTAEANAIVNAFKNKKEVVVSAKDIFDGASLTGYISRCETDLIRTPSVSDGVGYSLQFNFIESRR